MSVQPLVLCFTHNRGDYEQMLCGLQARASRLSRGENLHGRGGNSGGGASPFGGGMLVPACVPEDKVGEAPRSAWKLLTGKGLASKGLVISSIIRCCMLGEH